MISRGFELAATVVYADCQLALHLGRPVTCCCQSHVAAPAALYGVRSSSSGKRNGACDMLLNVQRTRCLEPWNLDSFRGKREEQSRKPASRLPCDGNQLIAGSLCRDGTDSENSDRRGVLLVPYSL